MPIFKASFLGKTGNVVASGRRPFFYLYNAEAGKVRITLITSDWIDISSMLPFFGIILKSYNTSISLNMYININI